MVFRQSQLLLRACLGLWIGLLVAGLWPFNFNPPNHVHWLKNENGLYFERYAQAYSTQPWTLNTAGDSSFTIELWLRPADTVYPHFSPIISIDSGSSDSDLSIAQSGPDLVVEGPFVEESRKRRFFHLWMDDACRVSRRLFVTISSGSAGTIIYWWDGSPHEKSYSGLIPAQYSGRVLVGHAPRDNQPWSGDIFELAAYHRALGAKEIAGDHRKWLAGDPPSMDAAALYTFNERSGNIVHNRAGTAPDLLLPSHFRTLHPTLLGFPHPLKRSDVSDTIVNVLGFIPFGFFFCAYIRSKRSIAHAVAITIVLGFATSIGIELLQVLLPSRDSSLLDVINNVLGTAMGSILEVKMRDLWRRIIPQSRESQE